MWVIIIRLSDIRHSTLARRPAIVVSKRLAEELGVTISTIRSSNLFFIKTFIHAIKIQKPVGEKANADWTGPRFWAGGVGDRERERGRARWEKLVKQRIREPRHLFAFRHANNSRLILELYSFLQWSRRNHSTTAQLAPPITQTISAGKLCGTQERRQTKTTT